MEKSTSFFRIFYDNAIKMFPNGTLNLSESEGEPVADLLKLTRDRY